MASADNNLCTQRRALTAWEQIFEDAGKGHLPDPTWPESPGDRPTFWPLYEDGARTARRVLTEFLELLGWAKVRKGVEIISLRESIDQDSAAG